MVTPGLTVHDGPIDLIQTQRLACVKHRGAIAADGLSGDGAGLLVPIPRRFFGRVGAEIAGRTLPEARLGVVTAFLDLADDGARALAERAVDDACSHEGLEVVGWRSVPIDRAHIGAARAHHAAPPCPATPGPVRRSGVRRRCRWSVCAGPR